LPLIPVPIKVEAGRAAEAVEEILARRESREEDAWQNVLDDLEATRLLVEKINTLYIAVLDDVQALAPRLSENDEHRTMVLDQVDDFLREDSLFGTLRMLLGRIAATSQSRGLRGRRHRDFVTELRAIERAVDAYLAHLDRLQAGEVPADAEGNPLWNLVSVRAALVGDEPLPLSVLCEEAIRNRRRDLKYAVDGLTGKAEQHIRTRFL
jgi:hypothetical protein